MSLKSEVRRPFFPVGYNRESMDPARIAALLEPFLTTLPLTCHSEERSDEKSAVLSATQLQSISTYIDILLRWNARVNLTAIRNPEEIVTRHFGESLFAARNLFPMCSSVPSVVKGVGVGVAVDLPRVTVADVGSGAGFPGLALKLWAPHISLTLIESNHKKCAFLREVTRALALIDVDVQNTRAETLTTTFDLVTVRAVERFETVLPIAAARVTPFGRLALLISSAQEPQARASLPALDWSPTLPIPQSRSRVLSIGRRKP